jgi:serine/threonine protein kinase
MIHFACLQCGMKFHVKDEFAGRSSRCPTCKNPLQVPAPDLTEAFAPGDRIDGTVSSLDRAGLKAGVTLPPSRGPAAAPPARSVAATLATPAGFGSRYLLHDEIARGGMGAVLRGLDRDLRREVAVKFMLDHHDAHKQARFIEEAQITGQLEHPNIVPVHELGIDAHRRLFFTMKMVRGRSLAQVLEALQTDPAAEKDWSLARLLNVLVNVCHALAYAHSRNVIHRDLKPANVMVGDFGEVYVMDWGLAKVLGDRPAAGPPPLPAGTAGASRQVLTIREAEGDLTQDGAILGTPAYMPPEQALGRVEAIDQRSDIYSLGAILYAVLTLEPPIGPADSYLAVLLRVAEGRVPRPEERAPERARRGLIPPELSAVALKALAREPRDRYPSVEAFRRDLERYREGRSVSARPDTTREQFIKFVKRNKAFSAAAFVGAALVLVVLGWSALVNYRERLRADEARGQAEKHHAAYVKEQAAKEAAIRRSVPALVRAGRQLANEGRIDQAGEQADLALHYDPDNAAARLLRGQVFVAQKQWPQARAELERCLRRDPGRREARELREAISREDLDEPQVLLALAGLLQRQRVQGLAVPLLAQAKLGVADREKLLPLYQNQIEARWRDLGDKLILTRKEGLFSLDLRYNKDLDDLSALQDIPLHVLNLNGCPRVEHLSPLKRMPLRRLELGGTAVANLEPLRGLPLEHLELTGCIKLQSLEPLRGCERLTFLAVRRSNVLELAPLRRLPLKTLLLSGTHVRSLAPLQGMSLTRLDINSCNDLQELPWLKGVPLVHLEMACRRIHDLRPLAVLKKLEYIVLNPDAIREGMEVLRGLDSLKTIKVVPPGSGTRSWGTFPAAEFWERYDREEFRLRKKGG